MAVFGYIQDTPYGVTAPLRQGADQSGGVIGQIKAGHTGWAKSYGNYEIYWGRLCSRCLGGNVLRPDRGRYPGVMKGNHTISA